MVKLALILVGMSVAGCSLILPKPTAEPICKDQVYVNKLETPIDTCRGVHPVLPVLLERRGRSDSNNDLYKDLHKDNKQDTDHDTDDTDDTDHDTDDTGKGNPGNDKQVGKAGEQDKDTGGSEGSNGASTGKV